MKIGYLLPGFSAHADDWAIPVQQLLVRELTQTEDLRILALRYPHATQPYRLYGARVIPLGYTHRARGAQRLRLWMHAIQTLIRLHRETPFDVLHATWADETGLIAAWAGKLLNIPVMVSIVGGELAQLDSIGYGLQLSAFSRWIVQQALTGADVVLSACHYVDNLIATLSYPVKRVERLVLGVDADFFRPLADKPASRRIVHAASLVPVKDQETLLRAFARLPEDTQLDVLGSGELENALKQLSRDLGIAERVHFHGAIPYPEMPAYYQRAALHVLSSQHEGLGMVTLEAAACGVPTVSTAVGLLPDCPELGLSVPVGDIEALAAAMSDLLDNPAKRHALGQSARAKVLERFTIQETARQLKDLYSSFATER